jgi:hypothetical protein
MSRVDAAAADRLPWLPDEPRPAIPNRRHHLLWIAAGIMVGLVALASFWLGIRSVNDQPPPAARHPVSTTIRLPQPRPATEPQVSLPAQRELESAPVREVRPAPVREVRIAPPSLERHASLGPLAKESMVPPASPAAPPAPSVAPVQLWNPRVIAGASGRLVQVGAFGSIRQAKRGWWFMVRTYPAVSHLPAVVRPSRNSKGRTFYRFQVGTSSQAHSEVLCQRMERIGLSCAVIGLPWKAKVER